ncbi:MAG: hypothetical protein HQ581_23640 [Planctomycetes bacterium]|nr:hypothetical protein [Planctomycetota bacterium]
MSLTRSPKLESIRSGLAAIRNRFGGKSRRGVGQTKHRRLLMDPLEERTLLSVAPADWDDVLVNPTPDTVEQSTLSGQSLAADNDGDFVVTWTRYDRVLDSIGNPVIDPSTGNPMSDANIYARYFTDEVQQLTLPDAIAGDADENGIGGSFSLLYGGNEVQKISITATNQPFTSFQPLIAGSVVLGFDVNGNGIVGPGETTTVVFSESNPFTATANTLETALRGLGGALTDANVRGINPHEFLVEFGNLSGGADQPEIAVQSVAFTSGFLPAVITSTVSEPTQLGPIFVSSTDPYQTANGIEQTFFMTSDNFPIGRSIFRPWRAGECPPAKRVRDTTRRICEPRSPA